MPFNKPKPWDNTEENIVVFHHFPLPKTCPQQSPFALKLECFMRIAGIKYVRDVTKPFGPTGKTPWITFNKKDLGDSQLIAEYLSKHFNVDIDSALDAERKGALEAARCMVDHHLFWSYALWRIHHSKAKNLIGTSNITSKFQKFAIRNILPIIFKRRSMSQGMGVHSEADQFAMSRKCMESLEALLGDRKFFGGESPCLADCAIFGMLCQMYWTEPGTKYEKLVKEDFPSLGRYCLAMKERIYPDWDSLLAETP